MPTYEYVCEKCGHEFDQFQSISAKALTQCPEEACGRKKWGKGQVKRKLSTGGGLLFKGSGFYITDYRSEGYKTAAKQDSDSAKSASAGSKAPATPAKTETKPAKPPAKN